ncbi:MAG TPA: radical SAM protein, partial [Candidatus Thermoplasmatota archaeon]|nr:radical SAM protein [Candidatus Thermoplasmatota archaeon]
LPQHFQTETKLGCPQDCGLCPDHEQHTCLGLIDLTDACNMRCPTCFANSDTGVMLPFETVEKMLDTLVASEVIADVVQFSGGEPTLHPRLFDILDLAQRKKIRHMMVNTNGIRIAQDEAFAARLAKYEDFEVYLQFDGLRRSTYETLRGQDMTEVRDKALRNLEKHNVATTLVAVLERGVNEDEVGDILRHALKFRNVRGVTFQPQTHAGRWTDFDPRDRITVPDVIAAASTQAPGLFEPSDFVPLPCHPECISMSYALRNGEELLPLPRILDVKKLLGVAGNTIAFETEPEVRGALKELWSASAAMQSLKTLKNIRCCLPLMKKDAHVGYENVFRIVIIAFMDAWNFDVRSAKKCCVHHVLPDGRIMPFCSYNTLHRTKMVIPS